MFEVRTTREAPAQEVNSMSTSKRTLLDVPSLVERLKDADPGKRLQAAADLAALGTGAREAVGPLVEAVNDSTEAVRHKAIDALGAIGSEAREAVPTLIRCLKDKDATTRTAAANVLTQIGFEAVPLLAQVLAGDDAHFRCDVAFVLSQIGPKAQAAIPALLHALKDEDDRIQAAAAKALKAVDPATATKAGVG